MQFHLISLLDFRATSVCIPTIRLPILPCHREAAQGKRELVAGTADLAPKKAVDAAGPVDRGRSTGPWTGRPAHSDTPPRKILS